MPIQFVLGRAGSGKTTWCLDRIRERLLDDPAGPPMIILVPEQATFQAEYALVSTPGLRGMMRAQALSFRRLAWRVMQETGGAARLPMNDTGKKMLLHHIIHTHRSKLRMFHQSVDQMGFIEQLNELFSEWKRYCVDSEVLRDHVDRRITLAAGRTVGSTAGSSAGRSALLDDKLHDLRLVYDSFEDELSRKYLDGEDHLTLLAAKLSQSGFLAGAHVWVDGFNGFTPQEFAVIEQLMKACSEVTITLCLDREYSSLERPHDLDLFHPTARTMVRLQELADQARIERHPSVVLGGGALPRFASAPQLASLEAFLAHRSAPSPSALVGSPESASGSGITICEASNRRTEVEAAAREIVRLVRDEGYRWRDLTVRVREIEVYGDLLQAVFRLHRIPFFIDQKRSVLHHPLVEFIRSGVEAVANSWRYDAVFRCVKTEFLYPLYPDEAAEIGNREARRMMDRLENYVLAFGIHGSRWTDDRIWSRELNGSLEDIEAEDNDVNEGSERRKQEREEREQCRSWIVEPLSAFQQRMKAASTMAEMTEGLFLLLQDTRVPEKLEQWSRMAVESGDMSLAREHTQVWDSIVDLLDQLVEIIGEEKASLDLFANLLETGLTSLRLAQVPPALDQVLIGSVDRTRSAQMKRCFLLGVSDGVFPARIVEEGVLTEAEREKLLEQGLPMAEGSRRRLLDEQFILYSTLCTPSHHLWLSYALADEEGKKLLPSEVIRRINRKFPDCLKVAVQGEPSHNLDEERQLDYFAAPGSVVSYLSAQLRQWRSGETISPIWWEAYNWFAESAPWRQALERLRRALFYSNIEHSLRRETSLQLYGETLNASVSRMEMFAACPFSQFAAYGLQLQERRIYRLAAPDIGQLFHAALSVMARRFEREGIDWGTLDEEQIRVQAHAAVEELTPRLQNEILLSSGRYAQVSRKLTEIVAAAASMLGVHARRGEFRPIGLELDFGPGKLLPPLSFQLPNGVRMRLRGRIDRVDQAQGTAGLLLRIIDYKSSRKSLQLDELYYGLSLQLLAYLDVVLTHAKRWLGEPASPAGVLYFHVHNPLVSGKNALPADRVESERFKRFKMRGLLLADAETAGLMDDRLLSEFGHSQLVPVALKKDGQFYQNSSIASPAEWDMLRGHVRNELQYIGSRITEGDVGIAPYRLVGQTPCTFCSYRSVCQFDPQYDGNGYRQLPAMDKDEAWQAIAAEQAGGKRSRRYRAAVLDDRDSLPFREISVAAAETAAGEEKDDAPF
ncbi:MAG: ATP-dependent helicase [Paenibacillaceae bacterium]|nr:ATP-dependent helicase [Paenibacillaceae bacterium]